VYDKVHEKEAFLASLSEAFAPELLDLEIGLMKGAKEIIPLGMSTIVIPADERNIELDIPIVRLPASSQKKMRSMFSRRQSSPEVSFSDDKGAKYTLNDGAFLRLQLSVEPGKISPPSPPPTGALDKSAASPRGGEFRSGPINKALQSRRKIDRLMASKKLSLSQRVQLYMELRSSKKATSKPCLQSQEVVVDNKQSDVSTVTHDFLFEGTTNPRPCETVPDDASGSLGLEMYRIDEEPSNSFIMTNSSKVASSVGNRNEANGSNEDTMDQLSQSSVPVQTIELSENDISVMSSPGRRCDPSSRQSLSHDPPHGPQKNGSSVNSKSLASFLDHPPSAHEGQSEVANDGIFTSDAATYFSSSLQSILTTNHPQKSLTQNMLRILACDADLMMCDKEKGTLEYYVNGLEQRMEGCGVLVDACQDDETLTYLTYDDATFQQSLLDEKKRWM